MIPEFGYGILVVTFILALYGIGAVICGLVRNSSRWIESARSAMLLTWPLISVVVLSLIYLLVTGHYEVDYVYNVTSNSMPLYLKITALWGGQAGSLLFWSWLMSTFAFAVTLRKWERDREFLPWVIIVCLVTLAFFLLLNILPFGDPFARYWVTPAGDTVVALLKPSGALVPANLPSDGLGLNPLLRHPGMIFHPPMLYLGFVSFVIPFAFAIAALVTGRTDDRWIRLTRRWTLVAWIFLSGGLVLGAWWAYGVLGWGGYWAWDPVEIAAFMPWLTGTAFLHSVMIQEKRGMFKQWNMILIILTYCLVIFGTFLTRSGVLSSVHAFSQSAIGPTFFAFIGLTFAVSLGLLLQRWNSLKSNDQMTSLLSRESLFLLNNLLFIGILVVCFWGVIFPIISELFTNQKVTVGPPFYQRATGPLFALLLLDMGIVPLAVWGRSTTRSIGKAVWKPFVFSLVILAVVFISGVHQWAALLGFWLAGLVASVIFYEYGRAVWARHKSTGEDLYTSLWNLADRNRRRYGGYIIHLGIVLMALGIIGINMFQTTTQGTIKPGESIKLSGYTITFTSFNESDTTDNRNVARAVVTVSKGGHVLGELYPRRDYYYEAQQQVTVPGVRSTFADDLYVVLVDWQPISSDGATFKVFHNPLVMWLWVGAGVLALGTLVAAWPFPEFDENLAKVKSSRKVENVL